MAMDTQSGALAEGSFLHQCYGRPAPSLSRQLVMLYALILINIASSTRLRFNLAERRHHGTAGTQCVSELCVTRYQSGFPLLN